MYREEREREEWAVSGGILSALSCYADILVGMCGALASSATVSTCAVVLIRALKLAKYLREVFDEALGM